MRQNKGQIESQGFEKRVDKRWRRSQKIKWSNWLRQEKWSKETKW